MPTLFTSGKSQFFDANGVPLGGGKVYTYASGTTTPKATYPTRAAALAATGANTNPVILDERGEAFIWFLDEQYRVIVRDSSEVTIYDSDSLNSNPLAVSTGAAAVGADDGSSGSIFTTVQGFITYIMALVVGFFTRTRIFYNAGDNGTVDRTVALQALVTTGCNVRILGGQTIRISDWINLQSNQTIYIDTGAQINQVTAGKGVFKASAKDAVRIENNGLLFGPGVWSSSWTGNGGHDERGVFFDQGCSNAAVVGSGTIRNFGHSAIAAVGGYNLKFIGQRLQGTNGYGSTIVLNDNFQMCVYLADDTGLLLGAVEVDCDCSGSAQGLVREHRDTGTSDAGRLTIRGHFHDIPGQHAIYVQRGNLRVDITVSDIALSAVKIQSPIASAILADSICNVVGQNIGSHVFELATLSTGYLADHILTGAAKTVGGGGLAVLGEMHRIYANLTLTNALLGFQAQGANQSEFEVHVNGEGFGQSGVAVYGTNSSYKIWPTLKRCNTTNTASDCGVLVNSVSATVELFDPDVTDSGTLMKYGLFIPTAGSVVKVRGSAKFTGGALGDVRATGDISEWPTDALPTNIARITSLGNIYSSQPMRFTGQSTSASNIVLLNYKMPDESAFLVDVLLVSKLSGTTERAARRLQALFYRDGGICTIQGAVTTTTIATSGSWAGAFALQSDGANNIVLICNSGGVATYDWMALLTVNRLV